MKKTANSTQSATHEIERPISQNWLMDDPPQAFEPTDEWQPMEHDPTWIAEDLSEGIY